MTITADVMVDALMRRRPATIAVFLRHRMLCVGCPIARFCSIADACTYYGMPCDAFLAELEASIRAPRRERVPG